MAKKKFNYEEALLEVQGILNELQENAVPIDELSEKVKKAAHLIAQCKEKLKKTENELDEVLYF